jgi:hypothetical protein
MDERGKPRTSASGAAAKEQPRNHALTAALLGGAVGGAVGATAGAWTARAIARKNGAAEGNPINAVLKTAATACELAHSPAAGEGGETSRT